MKKKEDILRDPKAYRCNHNRSLRRRGEGEKETEKILEKIMAT